MKEARILVVEDEVIVAKQIEKKLLRIGYGVAGKATTGPAAIKLATNEFPDLVLMDIKLEGKMDGIEAATRVRSELDIPVVYLTAHSDDKTLKRVMKTEPLGYLLKPFEENELRSTIEIALYKHKIDKQLRASEERYRTLFEGVPMPLYRTFPDGTIIDANPALVESLGFLDFETLKNANAKSFYVDLDERKRYLELLERDGVVHDFECQFMRKDGSIIWVNINARIVPAPDEKIRWIEGSMENITDRRSAEDDMKRRLMKFKLEEGNIYLTTELSPTLSVEAFKDLVNIGFHGTIISRTAERDWKKIIDGSFVFHWLAERGGRSSVTPKPQKLMDLVSNLHGKNVILLERIDYLVFKNNFKAILDFIQNLRELITLKRFIVLISLDPHTLKKHELRLIEKESKAIESFHESILSEDLLTVVRFVYRQNTIGIKPSYSTISKDLRVSRPTIRKRLTNLIATGYVIEHTKGNSKVVELTERGRELFWK